MKNPFDASRPAAPEDSAKASPALPGGESELHLSDYLEKLQRHWKLVALLVIVCLAGAGIRYFLTPKQYQAKARIQIERRTLSPVGSTDNPWLENWWNMEFYPTQYKLLESRGLAERVVMDLGLAEDRGFHRDGDALVPASEDLSSPEAADAAVLGRLAERLRGGLSVQPVSSTQLVDIVYRSSDPEFAAEAANGYAEAFIDWGISTRTHTAGRAASFLASQIEALKEEIQNKEGKLRAFSRETDLVLLEAGSNVALQRLQALNEDFMEAKGERIEKEARYRELLETPGREVAEEQSGGAIAELRRQHAALEREYETKLQTYKPEWPAMVELRAKIRQSRENLDRAIGDSVDSARESAYAAYQTALRRESSLKAELDAAKTELLDQSSAAVELTNLQVEIATSRDLLDKLLRQQSETEVAARLQTTRESNVRIVDRALMPGGPFRPSLRENLAMGLGLGLMLGLGAVVLIEYMDRTIKTPEEVERRLALPNLAVIPDVSAAGRSGRSGGYGYGYGYGYGARKRRGGLRSVMDRKEGTSAPDHIELVPHDRPRLSVSEAYRGLRTALLLSSADELRVVAITSAGSGEGKTATSTNLAVVMAQLGRRVLLIDGDLRKPRLHEVFGVSNRTGLVNILAGGEDPNRVTVAPAEVPNLHLVPSGPAPPNPSELLASDRMRDLLRRARSQFDFVILDTPPVLAVTDATVIGSHSDGVVLCLRAGKVLREDARTCRDRLLMNDVKILGTVLNRHKETTGAGRKYYYYEAYAAEAEQEPGSAA